MTFITESLEAIGEERKALSIKIDNFWTNAKHFYQAVPYFYDKCNLFWLWNDGKKKYEIVDDIEMMNMIDTLYSLEGYTLKSGIKNCYVEAFKRYGRKKMPLEPKKKWIQFKDKAFSIYSGKIHQVTKDYFFTNPISYEIGQTSETPIMDSLIESWVGKDYVNTVYEIIAYCCYSDYPIQTFFCFYGYGRNGKSCLLRLIKKFICDENICCTELDMIAGANKSRFETFKLYKKLVCQMGETNFGKLENSSILKKLVGGDMIGIEKKGKDPFDFINYAKIIIASNSLPISKDTSDGFYRRWIIIPFPNEFPEGKDILETIPEIEYNNLAKKVTEILPELLKRGTFTNQGSIKERKKNYIAASNPFSQFVEERCVRHYNNWIKADDLYKEYIAYLISKKNRRVSYRDFMDVLIDEGLSIDKTSKKYGEEYINGRFIQTVALKQFFYDQVQIIQNCDNCATCATISHSEAIYEEVI